MDCKAPAKRSQHANTTCPNIVRRNMLRVFGHLVATCCDMLSVIFSNFKMVNFEPTTPNVSEHIATRWSNARNMLRPTIMQHVVLACCDRLAEGLRTDNVSPYMNIIGSRDQFKPIKLRKFSGELQA